MGVCEGCGHVAAHHNGDCEWRGCGCPGFVAGSPLDALTVRRTLLQIVEEARRHPDREKMTELGALAAVLYSTTEKPSSTPGARIGP